MPANLEMKISIDNVREATDAFMKHHWPTLQQDVEEPLFWKVPYEFEGSVPDHDKQGCYALVEDGEIAYIRLGASRGGGIYEGHGIGARPATAGGAR